MVRGETELTFTSNDIVQMAWRRNADVLPAPFILPGNLTLGAGRYQWQRTSLRFETAESRTLSVGFQVECCDYYSGRSTNFNLGLSYHPNATVGAELNHQEQHIQIGSGRTTIRIDSLSAIFNFTPLMQLTSEWQYDNISRRLGASIRYQWQIHPATELFAALGESALLVGSLDSGSYHSQGTALVVRLGHRLQY
jgi:hypothetical protein